MRLTLGQLSLLLGALPLIKAHSVPAEQGTEPLLKRATKPSQNSDGSCYAYSIQAGEGCSQIASKWGLTQDELSKFNDRKTWGWTGCNPLQLGNICLSDGSPPLPAPVSNAMCGPTKPGTQKPASNVDISTLNPCPLNACCNKWGQCGITPEFCSPDTGPTGNPGTAPAGKNGCVSNCGTYIANLQQATTQVNVAYFETWNWDRPCLNMRVTDIDRSKYTHIHWAFATVDPNTLQLVVNDTFGEWQSFKSLTGVKRIISIGGWGFSTGYDTYDIFRRATKGADQNLAFAKNIINFLNVHNLDGVDLDWEYPGAPDNQGLDFLPPKGDPWDGGWYYILLNNLRQNMPTGKTVSIAAPASYWYLQGFPIKDMATKLDYIVYMTYDLHGQWDYNNKWTQEGCPGGNCLRSHVNNTETAYALAMVTKAGVPTNKIVVGVASYGRSFGMVNQYCDGEMCRFKGPDSAATKGRCTGVAGYISNAEINEIIAKGGSNVRTRFDTPSGSNILVYGDQYVAYMNDTTKASRKSLYKAYQFLGTADWAVDLQSFYRTVQPGQFSPGQPSQPAWDLTKDEIIAKYAIPGYNLNSRLQDVCVFYLGHFREEATQLVCAYQQRFNLRLMADMFIAETFDEQNGPRARARAEGFEREWFRRLSEIFAQTCYGRVRFVWDNHEPFNIGSMETPDFHTQWDWYEWPILHAREADGSVQIFTANVANGFKLEYYVKPKDASSPPGVFQSPGSGPRKLIRDTTVFDLANTTQGLSRRDVEPDNCLSDVSCQACVYNRLKNQPNTEIGYAQFQDNRRWNQGTCIVRVDQTENPQYQGGKFSAMNITIQDDLHLIIGNKYGRWPNSTFERVEANLPASLRVRPNGPEASWILEFSYDLYGAPRRWSSAGSACSSSNWLTKRPAPSPEFDSMSRVVTCTFSC